MSRRTMTPAFDGDAPRASARDRIAVTQAIELIANGRIVLLVGIHVVRILAGGSLDSAFGAGDGIMKFRRLVVELSDVAVQADGDLAFAGDALGYAIGENELERGFMIAARVRADELVAPVVGRGGDARASG